MSASTPLTTSHASAEPSSNSSGPRARVSVAVTSVLVEAEDIWKVLLLGAVFLGGQFHRTVDGKLNDAGFLIDPSVSLGLAGLLFAEVQHGLAARGRGGFPSEVGRFFCFLVFQGKIVGHLI